MPVLIDTNVFIALLDEENPHHKWAVEKYNKYKSESPPLVISDIVYCEASIGMPDIEAMNAAVKELGLDRISAKNEALFEAGRAFIKYKDVNKGQKNGVLPDFLIGAIAADKEIPIITADPKPYIHYFNGLEVIKP